ncbi:MAG TPA: helical backbone metal receptor [Rhodothermales bacterium]|nr:helical backbone metal receptor [Rhodothermales bacterium]
MAATLERRLHPMCSALIVMSVLLGCGGRGEPTIDQRVVVDDIGREVRVPVRPTRVVSLAPSITEVVFAAGAGDRLAAVTTSDNYPTAVAGIRQITAFPLDHEAIVALGPDLLLATDQINSVRDLDALSEVGIPAYFLRFTTADDVFLSIRIAGRLLGTEERANRTADSLQAIWNGYITSIDTISYIPSVLLLAGYDVLYAFGRDSYTNEIIRAAGGRSVTDALDGQAATLSEEFVLAAQPDVIVGTFGDDFDVDKIVAGHPTWASLPAAQRGRVYSIDPDLISRPGPRIIEGAKRIAEWVDGAKSTATAQ